MDKNLLDKRINEILLEKGYIRVSELASEFNINERTMNYFLKKEGYREKDIFVQLPKNYIKVFENINEEVSYWLGYLQADGCVNIDKNNRKRLILECQENDKELLENFCTFTNINKKRIKNTQHIKENNKISKAVRIDLYSSCFSVFPDKWIKPKKSYLDEELPNDVIFYDYLLGLIDGDGCIYKGERGSQIQILCRNPMAEQIINQLKNDLPIKSSVWLLPHPKTSGLFIITIGSGGTEYLNFKYLYNKFYSNKNYNSLQRKKEKLKEIISCSL